MMWKNIAQIVTLIATTTLALECNICGPGTQNIMGEQLGVVTLEYEGVEYKQNCEKWQDSKLLSEEWCAENMLEYTYDICKCVLPDGSLVKDAYSPPTVSPAPTFPDPTGPGPSPNSPVVPVSPSTNPDAGTSSSSRASVLLGLIVGLVMMTASY